jgi:hypothetical protein
MTAAVSNVTTAAPSKTLLWVGRAVSALPVLALVASGLAKLTHQPKLVEGLTQHYGFPADAITVIAVLELVSILLYVVPQTAFFGAILVTAYLGGAVATHVRVGDPVTLPVILGVLAWLGLYLRDGRLRALAPLRSRLE